jgi:ParB family transcriptional regulator, chromosome partitioning protein
MQTTTPVTRVDLDPRTLLVDVNIRTDARLDKDFVASIKDFGVLVPITAVRTAAGDVRVRFGHRRTLAAIEADLETVPVQIVGDEATDDTGQIERILTQHAENAHRTPLLQNEQIGVVEQLNAFGLSAAQIAKRTKIKRDTVNTALAVAKSELAKAASDRYDFLTLEQAAAVAEFDDDADAVKELIVKAQNGNGFDHCLQRLRNERQYQRMTQPIIDELAAADVVVIDQPRWTDPTRRLEHIGTDDGPLTPEEHASCAGHVAWIEEDWVRPDDAEDDDDLDEDDYLLTFKAVYGCSDPVAYGHIEPAVDARTSRNGSRVSDEEARAVRREVIANNKAWRTAETVRREWLKTFVARKSAPKGALRFILSEVAEGDRQLREAMERRHRFACELLGITDAKTLSTTLYGGSDARAQMIALALVLCAHEIDLGVHTWRSPTLAADRYLSQIAAWGYELSEIEQSVIRSNDDGE